jgi:hypothetical protein
VRIGGTPVDDNPTCHGRTWPKGRRVNELVPLTKVEIDCRP